MQRRDRLNLRAVLVEEGRYITLVNEDAFNCAF